MKLLRRVLYWDAAVSAFVGVALALFPAFVLQTLFDQVPLPEYAWVRMAGVEAVGLAMLEVIVAHRIEDLWWASWAFVLTGGAVAFLSAINALFGLPAGSSALLWWLLTALLGVFTTLLLIGLAQTGLQKPPG